MTSPDYKKLKNGEAFEKLCSDILFSEGFIIESEPKVDRTGFDIVAIEEYKSHRGESIRIKWKVQCKHFAESNRTLGRKDVEEYIYAFEAVRGKNEGLLFIIDTDYSEPAKEVIDKYVNSHHDARVMIWNGRHLSTILERHPNLLAKYDLVVPRERNYANFDSLSFFRGKKVLIISDQSNLAHNLTAILKFYNFEITFLPIWNYVDPVRLNVFDETVLQQEFDLIICFLGDTFQFLLPDAVCKVINRNCKRGTGILFFPFFAYCINKGHYKQIGDLMPVSINPPDAKSESRLSNFRFGDFRFLLYTDLFAEDQYTEIVQNGNCSDILPNFSGVVPLKHTFEYLVAKPKCRVLLKDLSENPFLIVNEKGASKIAYFNTCTHSCLTSLPISSPIEASPNMNTVFNDILNWLLTK